MDNTLTRCEVTSIHAERVLAAQAGLVDGPTSTRLANTFGALSAVRQLAFDKTGTLTRGAPAVTFKYSVNCTKDPSCTQEPPCAECADVLALASALERRSAHPLARAVVNAAEARGLAGRYAAAEDVTHLNGRGLQGRVDGKLATIGNHALFEDYHPHQAELCEMIDAAESRGQTTILLALSGLATLWMAVAADMGVSLLITLNGLRPLGLRE